MRVSEYIQGVTKVCVSIQESQNYTGLGIQALYISHQKIKDGRRCRRREGPRGLEEKRVNRAGLEMITYTDMSNVY